MYTANEMLLTAQERLGDAEALISCTRPQGAVYLCGYAIEIRLKATICGKDGLPGFPEKAHEFSGSMKKYATHSLEKLLNFSGKATAVKSNNLADWSILLQWDPESRYANIQPTFADACAFIESAKRIMGVI